MREGITALPGVAIAVALMPPLYTMGFGLGSGVNAEIIGGAGLLFLTNLVAIVASAFLVFLGAGMGTAHIKAAAHAFHDGGSPEPSASVSQVGRLFATGGQLVGVLLMILILLGAIAVPLWRALLQVANETLTRGTVENALKYIAASNEIVSEQVNVGDDLITIRLISTKGIPEPKVSELRSDLSRRTGRDVRISVDAVASKRDVAELLDRLNHPAPTTSEDKKKTVAEIQQELIELVRPAIMDIWPSEAPIRDFDIVVGSSGTTVDVQYEAANDLGIFPSI